MINYGTVIAIKQHFAVAFLSLAQVAVARGELDRGPFPEKVGRCQLTKFQQFLQLTKQASQQLLDAFTINKQCFQSSLVFEMSSFCENPSDRETVVVCASEPALSNKSSSASTVKAAACEPSEIQNSSTSSFSIHQEATNRQAPMFNGRRPTHTTPEMHSLCVTSPRDEPHVFSKDIVHTTPTKDKPAGRATINSSSHTIYPEDNSFKMESPLLNNHHHSHMGNIPVDVGPKVVPSEQNAESTHLDAKTGAEPGTAPVSRTGSGGAGNSVASMMSNLLHGRRPSHKPSAALAESTSHVEVTHAAPE